MEKLRELLENNMSFPGVYTYKFVVPSNEDNIATMLDHLADCEISQRFSSNKKFVSFTGKKNVASVDEIVMTYERVQTVPGLISL